MGLPTANADLAIKNADHIGNQKINYTEFLAATLHVQNELTDERLWTLFKTFDTDESGNISKPNLKEAFARMGRAITDQEINSVMEQHDID
jgi:calcium-dependent protein kinase